MLYKTFHLLRNIYMALSALFQFRVRISLSMFYEALGFPLLNFTSILNPAQMII